MAELSEGEIIDSNSSCELQEPDLQHVNKKRKLKYRNQQDSSECTADQEDDGGGWESALSTRKKKRLQKREQRKKEKETKKKHTNSISDSCGLHQSNPSQSTILQALADLVDGKSNTPVLPKLKTALFQGLISNLILSPPPSFHSEVRVLVIWLSNVSEEYFSNSEKHFAQVKMFNPSVNFKIEHPGSNRFAKLGLESFMMIQKNGQPESFISPTIPSDTPPTRLTYLFSKEDLRDHGFPIPNSTSSPPGKDYSQFCSVAKWPDIPIEEAAAQEEGAQMPMFAIDCEMVENQEGQSELARISIVNESLECVYDSFVKPATTVKDYRTRYSGVDEECLRDVTTTLGDIHDKLCTLLPSGCILIGHSLENDLDAMKFIHPYVIDTSCIFTPNATPINKPSLRRLHKELLMSDIQADSGGHNSIEDATACMKLVQLKLRDGHSCQINFNPHNLSLLSTLQAQGKRTAIIDKAGVVYLFGKVSSYQSDVVSDSEAVKQTKELVSLSNLTFVQLHDMENFVKSSERENEEKRLAVADGMDSNVVKMVEGCPGNTLVFVVCGSSDISKVKQLQQHDVPDMRRLKEAVMVARTGMVVAFLVN